MKRDTFPPCMTAAGFDPAKRIAHDLKSGPFDLAREHCLVCFSTLEASTPSGTRTHNPQIRSLMRYPIAPLGRTEILFLLYPWRGLNPRPRAHKTRALTDWATETHTYPYTQTNNFHKSNFYENLEEYIDYSSNTIIYIILSLNKLFNAERIFNL